MTRFATDQGEKAPRSTFYVDPYIQDHRFSGTSDGHSFVDVTLDSKAQTILYNELTFKTDAPTVLSTSYDEPLAGTFKTAPIQATITVNPVSISVKHVGPLLLHRRDSNADIELAGKGIHGGFAAIPLTGTYSVSRGKDTVAGKFRISLPISRNRQFPEQRLDVRDHPKSILLKGVGSFDDIANWIDFPPGQNTPNRTNIYRGKVGGIETVLELQSICFSRASEITLLPVPLAGPGIKGNAHVKEQAKAIPDRPVRGPNGR